MRCVSVVMSCLAVGAFSTAPAQTASPVAPAPSTQASTPPATAAPAATAATAAPSASTAAAAPAAPTVYPMDKQMISKGYKPEMHGSERVYCRKEDQIGTHLPPVKTCVTAEQAAINARDAKEYTENAQRMAAPPKN